MTTPFFYDPLMSMVDEMLEHPRVHVTHLGRRKFSKTGKQTYEEALRLRRRDPKPLREVFAALGGFLFRWELIAEGTKKRKPSSVLTPADMERPAAGQIAIVSNVDAAPPAGLTVLDHHSDERLLNLGGRSFPERSFRASLRWFDRAQYNTVEWVSPEGGPEGLTLGMDAHADYSAPILSVPDYMRILIASRGVPQLKREMFLGTRTPEQAPQSLEELIHFVETTGPSVP